MSKQDSSALFLGPKSENYRFFKDMLNLLMDEHIFWRRDFHPDDKAFITHTEQRTEDYCATLDKIQEALYDLSSKMKTSSIPWFSTRYLGHMNSDVLLPAVLGYMAGILYNPNNCAYEGAPATTAMELEVGKELGVMMGYNSDKAWGHITSGGTVANYEGLWYARNLKSMPFAVREVNPKLVKGLNDWQLLNLSTEEILNILDKVKREGSFNAVFEKSVRSKGVCAERLGKLLVPQSRHYSWDKAADILGVGNDNVIHIKVTEDYRMDVKHLKSVVDDLISRTIPVLGVVSVVGTTEEGAVDEVHNVVELRKMYKKKGINFYYHIDAAYGGYARTMFLDERNNFIPYERLIERLDKENFDYPDIRWPDENVYMLTKLCLMRIQ